MKYARWAAACIAAAACATPAFAVDFTTEVWPILQSRCFECHGPDRVKGDLRLDSQDLILKGGESGPVIVAGKPEESKLYQLIILPADDADIMPAKGDPLTPEQTELIRAWIAEGAAFGAPMEAEAPVAEPAAEAAAAPAEAPAEPQAPGVSLAALAEGLAPAPEESLASVRDLGVIVLPLSQDMPLLDANFQLKGKDITDESLALLAPLAAHITRLNLAGTGITDAGLANLTGLKNLTALHLEKTAITDAGLEQIKALQNLEYLNLYGTQVTDAGLPAIGGLPNLRKLYLWQTAVTKDAAAAFSAAHPEVKVDTGWEAPPPDPAEKLAAFFDEGSCCAQAHAEGKTCDHDCCKAALAEGKICDKCNPIGAAKVAMAALYDADSCCAKAHAEGKACDHPCCVEARGKGEVCLKCNPGAAAKEPPAPEAPPAAAEPADTTAVTPAAEKTIGFNRDIRQILSNNCFQCHGPDKSHRKADMRLDIREVAVAARGDITPIVPGNSAASEVVKRIMTADPLDMMPPPESGKSLTAAQKDLIVGWIDEGAEYEPHWSYIDPARPTPPPVQQSEPIENDIDKFIVTRLEKEGLLPSPEADRATLIRRLSFDLRGLPPTPEEVSAFENDTRPDAYAQLVERFLASPQYGERMAVHWLDLVRYADTNGFHGDEYRSIWPYRDYVVRAFNNNMRYDEFTIEQLAGDLLPDATTDQKVAAAYNRLNQLTAEGGAQPKEYTAKYMADRVRTVATVWLGATMGCAECHDHKFDPYTAKDFYSMGAFFSDIDEQAVYGAGQRWEPIMYLPTEDQQAQEMRLETTLAELRRELTESTDVLKAAQAEWEQEARAALAEGKSGWTNQTPLTLAAQNGTTLQTLDDASVLSGGEHPATEVYTVSIPAADDSITGLRLEALMHESLPNQGLSRGNGNFVLTGVAVDRVGPEGRERVSIANAAADFEQPDFAISKALDTDPKSGWAVSGHELKGKEHQAVFVFESVVQGGAEVSLEVRLRFESQFADHAIGRFRLATSSQPRPGLDNAWSLTEDLKQVLLTDAAARTPDQAAQLEAHYRSIAPLLDPVRQDIAQTEAKQKQIKEEMPYTMVTRSVEPRVTRVLARGDWQDESGEVVEPAPPSFLPAFQPEGDRGTRLDLAKWIVSENNPLTARVFVNRLWALYFGNGLSKVLDDLGSQGEWPTHPELLDWLATEFMDSGWDVKHMVRLIVTSHTYRASSRPTPEINARDPENRLLARQTRYRLDAEFVRDNALAISGLLSEKMFGPPVKPYQPDGYWDNCNTFTGKLIYDTSSGEDQYRRGLYTYWKRSFLHPSLLAFDAPTREECTAERTSSNTPLQALVLLNDPSYVEAARVFATRILHEGGDTAESRLDFAFRCALARPPADREKTVLLGLLQKHSDEYANNPADAEVLLGEGQRPMPEDLSREELAAWTSVARAILNLHETITRS